MLIISQRDKIKAIKKKLSVIKNHNPYMCNWLSLSLLFKLTKKIHINDEKNSDVHNPPDDLFIFKCA